jgi:hypothetical protein
MKDDKFLLNLKECWVNICVMDKEIGYVNGMTHIIAFFLILYGNECSKTVEIFLKIMNLKSKLFVQRFKNAFINEFKLITRYIDKFHQLLEKIDKQLYDKLIIIYNNEIPWLVEWIQTLFLKSFRIEIAVRLIDIIIHHIDLIILICLAIVQYCSKDIIKANNKEDVIENLKSLYDLPESKNDLFINYIINFINKNIGLL